MQISPDAIAKPWLKFYDENIPHSLSYPAENLAQLYKKSTQEYRDKIAVSCLGADYRFEQIEDYALKMASFLKQRGVNQNDKVLLLLPNIPQFIIAYYAVLKLGAVVVPASPLDTPAEVAFKAQNSGASCVIFLDLLYDKVKDLREQSNIHTFVSADIGEILSGIKKLLFPLKKRSFKKELPDYKHTKFFKFFATLKSSPSIEGNNDNYPQTQTAVIIYTGGTTGVSKGVVLSHRAMVVNMTQARTWGGVRPDDVALCVLPFFHGFGMSIGLNTTFISGGKMVLMLKWETQVALQHIGKSGITIFAGVPTMYNAMLNHRYINRLKSKTLRGCYVGAAPVPEIIKKEFFQKTGGTLIEGYGLTEAVTAKSACPFQGLKKEKSIGIPWPDTTFAIVDENTKKPLGPNQEGELVLHAPDLMSGYYNNEKATADTIIDGWLYTGDIAKMDDDGYFYIVDRKKDLIITGGFNVYPAEIEELLYQHPNILEATVIGVKDDHKGELGKAFVVLKDKTLATTGDDIKQYLSQKLIDYKIPRYYEFRDSLPKSPIGKILKKELRE